MKFHNLSSYLAPDVEVYCVVVEYGFGGSTTQLPEYKEDDDIIIGRNVFYNNDNGKLDYMFQAAVLSTTTEQFTEDERLELAFGEKTDFNKVGFLTEFANFGVTKLVELIGNSTLESMDNIKNFLVSTVEGRNLEIEELPDDLLLYDE